MQNTTGSALYDLLITRDFEPEILDSMGKAVTDPSEAELFSFDWKTPNKNYGTVVILLGQDQDLQIYFGDNLGRTMEGDDKSSWYEFLNQIKSFATRNLLTFDIRNINRLKYTMQGMAAIKEGLFEGYYGTRRVSYSDQPKKTRLMIRHSRDLGEDDARYRAIESLFVETAQGERFKLPFTKLIGGRAMARHCAEGGTPYDAFGQHISDMMSEMNTLGKFVRAARARPFEGQAHDMVEAAVRHYSDLKARAKRMISQRGYREERDQFDPSAPTDVEAMVETIRDMFVEQTLDTRIEEALPILARLADKEQHMREINQFESWANQITEGTWALPETPEQKKRLQDLMSRELIVGPDATNATEQLYDLVGDDTLFDILDDISNLDPDANAWDDSRVQQRLQQLGVDIAPNATAEPDTPMPVQEQQDTAKFQPVQPRATPEEGPIHNINHPDVRLLPGFQDNSGPEDYSSTYYYRDPISGGIFAIYTHSGAMRVRGTGGMDEDRVEEIRQTLDLVKEDLDTDGVMMTRPSNMSNESNDLDRLRKLALI
jgi:hypothetical protein